MELENSLLPTCYECGIDPYSESDDDEDEDPDEDEPEPLSDESELELLDSLRRRTGLGFLSAGGLCLNTNNEVIGLKTDFL